MELAIKVMRQSVEEPRKDNKKSPKVGAVLVKLDGTVDTACRGELRYGDHAEFTVLERKNRSEKLDGSTLYATLEPCAPGSRKEPKCSCAERIVNARIKKVYVGMEDDDPTVARKGIQFLEESGVEVEMFPRDLQEEIQEANKEFIADAQARAHKSKQNKIELSPLERHSGNFTVNDDFDGEAIILYQNRLKERLGKDVGGLNNRFVRIGVCNQQNNGKIHPSGFGLLLFGKEPREAFRQAGLLAKVSYSNGQEEYMDFEQALVLVPEALENWLRKVSAVVADRSSAVRREEPDLPMVIIREAVVNALIHRDYGIEGAKCHLEIEPDKIVVKSPGRPQPPVTLEQLQNFDAPMLSRNPLLHYVFSQMRLAEEKGLGLRTLKRQATESSLPLPRYEYHEPYLVLTIFRSVDSALAVQASQPDLSDDEKAVWLAVERGDGVSSPDIAEDLHFDLRKVQRILSKLLNLDLIEKQGQRRATTYHKKL
jgi:ATP-dependent DNA helicase RecG